MSFLKFLFVFFFDVTVNYFGEGQIFEDFEEDKPS